MISIKRHSKKNINNNIQSINSILTINDSKNQNQSDLSKKSSNTIPINNQKYKAIIKEDLNLSNKETKKEKLIWM